jgi:hypothetical protein
LLNMKMVALCGLFVVAGCDPGWEIKNPATASKQVDAACVEAGLRTWTPDVKVTPSIHGEEVHFDAKAPATAPYPVHLHWRASKPNEIEISVFALGEHAPTKALEGYRTVRDEVVAQIGASCGATVALGPEHCQRCD